MLKELNLIKKKIDKNSFTSVVQSPDLVKYSTRVDSSVNKSNLSVGKPKSRDTNAKSRERIVYNMSNLNDDTTAIHDATNSNLYRNNVSQIKNSLDIFINESKNIKKIVSFSKERSGNNSHLHNLSETMARTPSTTKHKKKSSEALLNNSSSEVNSVANLTYYTDNVKKLEKCIEELKTNGLGSLKRQVEEKIDEKGELELTVERLKKRLKFLQTEIKNHDFRSEKQYQSNTTYNVKTDRTTSDNNTMNREINALTKLVGDTKLEIGITLAETRNLKSETLDEEKRVAKVREEIRKYNKLVTDTQKERENIKGGITLLRKHIKLLKEKIDKEENKTQTFLSDVSKLLQNS